MAKVVSTREIIEKLEAYEKQHGVGAVVGIATVCSSIRPTKYEFEIANDSSFNRFHKKNDSYKETTVEILSVEDDDLFEQEL